MLSFGLLSIQENFKCKTFPCSPSTHLLGVCKSFMVSSSTQNEINCFSLQFFQEPSCFPLPESVLEIATNSSLALFLTSRNIWILGEDSQKSGLFGVKDVENSNIPVKLQGTPECLLKSVSVSECHAGFISEDGSLFTWGMGNSGELGKRGLQQSEVRKVDNGNFFKGKQVVCGDSFTAVVTEGGFLYVFGNRVGCLCGGVGGYPATISTLEEFFVDKAYAVGKGIVLITDEQKVFVTNRCLCLFRLKASKAVNCLGVFEDGIFGLSSDKTRLYLWQSSEDNEPKTNPWKSQSFKLSSDLTSIFSSQCQYLPLLGSGLDDLETLFKGHECSPDISPHYSKSERKSFDQIMSSYNFQKVLSTSTSQKEACKILSSILEKYFAECFRKIKEFAWIRSLYKKTYNYRFFFETLEKTLKKKRLDKTSAFFRLKRLKRPLKLLKIFKVPLKKIDLGFKINLVRAITKNDSKILAFYLKVFKNLVKPSRTFSAILRHPFEISLRIIETHNQVRVKYLFNLWKGLSKPFLSTCLKTFIMIFSTFLTRILKRLSLSRPLHPEVKIGFFILSSVTSNVIRKRKTQSFNTLIRQVSYQRHSEGSLFYSKEEKVPDFQGVNPFFRLHGKEKCLKLVLIFQALQEKGKSRMVIRGFNAFVSSLMIKSQPFDNSISKTFFSKESKFFVTPPCTSPILDLLKRNSERSTSDTTVASNARTASVSALQDCIRRRIEECRRTGPVKKMKIIKKRSEVNTTLEKRIAYDGVIKERQRKRESSGLFTSCSSRKQSFFASPRNKSLIIQLD